MSSRNGDKARFHRLRKAKIARRSSVRELRQKLADAKTTNPAATVKPVERP